MSNKTSNYPANQLNNLPSGTNANLIGSIRELAQQGKPQNERELQQRIDDFFRFCETHDFRPGVEALALSLGTSRQTFWNWCNGLYVSQEWMEICLTAKQYVLTYIEAASLSGKLNPATSIFVLKNWGNYKDSLSFDETVGTNKGQRILGVSDLPQLGSELEESEE